MTHTCPERRKNWRDSRMSEKKGEKGGRDGEINRKRERMWRERGKEREGMM